MNPGLRHLQPYPFERLANLRKGVTPNAAYAPIVMHIGEPQHAAPAFILKTLRDREAGYGSYPASRGIPELRGAIAAWLTRRFQLPPGLVDPERNVLPVNGTREALFAAAQCVIDQTERAAVVMPNPFYQIYEGAALLAGASPVYLNCTADNDFLPNYGLIPETIWRRTQLVYVCSPGNPTGKVESLTTLRRLLELSDQYGFVIASDECYSEIYPDEGKPSPGLLQACAEAGRADFKNCLVFHSLSKRSNVPGLRSGFVAGDATVLEKFLLYRTYHGCAMPVPVQYASAAAWADEAHVRENRQAYREKFAAVLPILEPVLKVRKPDAAFYLWAETPISDEDFALRLVRDFNVSVLPGTYLSRESKGLVPGRNHVRISLTATLAQCVEAAERIRTLVQAI